MKAEELIVGEYYAVTYGTDNLYIFLNVDNNGKPNQPYIHTYNKYFGTKGQLNGISNTTFRGNESYRKATPNEIKHLDACIKAGTYIEAPKDEVINDYNLY